MKWARQLGYISENPIAELEAPSAERREDTISKEEFEKVLSVIPCEHFRDLLVVCYETGCRPQEIRAAQAQHFNVEQKLWMFKKSESKLKRKVRIVYLTDKANEICKKLVAKYPEGNLFRNSNGQPWTNYAVQCVMRRVRIRLGKQVLAEKGITISEAAIKAKILTLAPTKRRKGKIMDKTKAELRCEAKRKLTQQKALKVVPPFCLYVLRHSFATRALLRGVDSLTVAQLLGHEDCSTLSKVYQHLSSNPEFLLAEAKKISS